MVSDNGFLDSSADTNFYNFFSKKFFGHAKRHGRSYFLKQKLKPCPLHWKLGALTKGLPGNFPPIYHSCLSKSLDRDVFGTCPCPVMDIHGGGVEGCVQ